MSKVKKTQPKRLIDKVAPKHVLDKNVDAFEMYDDYKKTADIIDRAEAALGRGITYRSNIVSTLDFEINHHGIYSTTA